MRWYHWIGWWLRYCGAVISGRPRVHFFGPVADAVVWGVAVVLCVGFLWTS